MKRTHHVLATAESSRIALLLRASYSDARKPRDGSGTVLAHGQRALPLVSLRIDMQAEELPDVLRMIVADRGA